MIVGTAGHVDHGKTSLVRALTGIDTDRLKEEKARGITIDLGFAYWSPSNGVTIGFVDVPGHERFVNTMVAGAGAVDFALLVVAADDGVMPQTREHLAILDLLGVHRGLVALSKADLAGPERRAEVEAEIRDALAGTALEGSGIIAVSTATGEGVDTLRADLVAAALDAGTASHDGAFRLSVDRCFTLQGTGTVVTGTVLSGHVEVGDGVVVSPAGLAARVRSLHVQNAPATLASSGDRAALALSGEGISPHSVGRGDMVVAPHLHAPSDRLDAVLTLLPGEAVALRTWLPVRFHHGAAETGARLVPLGERPAPGDPLLVQVVLEEPLPVYSGDRFILRDTSARRTIAGGRILDVRAPARRRQTPERLAQLRALDDPDPTRALVQLLGVAPYVVDAMAFARDHALSRSEGEALPALADAEPVRAGAQLHLVEHAAHARLVECLVEVVGAHHRDNPDLQGLGVERLRMMLKAPLPAPVFRAFLGRLQQEGIVALAGAWVALPGHHPRLAPQDEALWSEIEPHLGGGERFRPPRVRDIAGALGTDEVRVRRVLRLAARQGRVDEVAHDHFFLRSTVAEMVDIVRDVAAQDDGGQLTAARFRDRVANGRKVAIQILEFLDRHGVTLRRGDQRRMNPHRLDLFAPPAAADPEGGESSPVGRPDFKSG